VNLFLETNYLVVQRPSEYCSTNKAPNVAQEKLIQLSVLGLQAPSSTEIDANNTSEHLAMTSQTDASSPKDFDLTLTTEEYNEYNEYNEALGLQAPSSTELDVYDTSEHLAMTSKTDASSSKDFDLNLTPEEYNENEMKNKKMKIG